jgi:hypothetical protein
MPVGEYALEDGMVLVVAVEGIIAEVKEAEIEEEAAPEVEVEVEANAAPQAPAPQAKRVVESVSKETFFAEIEKLRAELSLQINEVKAENESLKSEKEALEVKLNSNEEGAEPIVQNPESDEKVQGFSFGQNRPETIQDKVYDKMFN